MRYTHKGVHKVLLKKVQANNIRTILDVGSGAGHLMDDLHNLGYSVSGCDKNIDLMQYNYENKYFDLNKDSLPYPNSSFDCVICGDVIEHVHDHWKLVEEVYRVLKQQGTFLLSTPNNDNWYSRLFYLFNGKLLFFNSKDYREGKLYWGVHITPVIENLFRLNIHGKFEILTIDYNRSIIPLIRIRLPFNNGFFGENMIIEMRKIF